MSELEEGRAIELDFGKIASAAGVCPDIIPVAVQNADTGEVILVAYTNEAAFKESMASGTAVFWSTSRNERWLKGETSGHTFDLVEALVNCEQNSLLYKVRPKKGGICHTSNAGGQPRNCYYRRINPENMELENLDP